MEVVDSDEAPLSSPLPTVNTVTEPEHEIEGDIVKEEIDGALEVASVQGPEEEQQQKEVVDLNETLLPSAAVTWPQDEHDEVCALEGDAGDDALETEEEIESNTVVESIDNARDAGLVQEQEVLEQLQEEVDASNELSTSPLPVVNELDVEPEESPIDEPVKDVVDIGDSSMELDGTEDVIATSPTVEDEPEQDVLDEKEDVAVSTNVSPRSPAPEPPVEIASDESPVDEREVVSDSEDMVDTAAETVELENTENVISNVTNESEDEPNQEVSGEQEEVLGSNEAEPSPSPSPSVKESEIKPEELSVEQHEEVYPDENAVVDNVEESVELKNTENVNPTVANDPENQPEQEMSGEQEDGLGSTEAQPLPSPSPVVNENKIKPEELSIEQREEVDHDEDVVVDNVEESFELVGTENGAATTPAVINELENQPEREILDGQQDVLSSSDVPSPVDELEIQCEDSPVDEDEEFKESTDGAAVVATDLDEQQDVALPSPSPSPVDELEVTSEEAPVDQQEQANQDEDVVGETEESVEIQNTENVIPTTSAVENEPESEPQQELLDEKEDVVVSTEVPSLLPSTSSEVNELETEPEISPIEREEVGELEFDGDLAVNEPEQGTERDKSTEVTRDVALVEEQESLEAPSASPINEILSDETPFESENVEEPVLAMPQTNEATVDDAESSHEAVIEEQEPIHESESEIASIEPVSQTETTDNERAKHSDIVNDNLINASAIAEDVPSIEPDAVENASETILQSQITPETTAPPSAPTSFAGFNIPAVASDFMSSYCKSRKGNWRRAIFNSNFVWWIAGKKKDVESPKEKEQPSTPISFGGFGVPATASNFMTSLAGKEKDGESPKEKEQPSTPISFGGFSMPAAATNFMSSFGGKDKDVESPTEKEQPSTPVSFGGFGMPAAADNFMASFAAKEKEVESPKEREQPATPISFGGFGMPAVATNFMPSSAGNEKDVESPKEKEQPLTPISFGAFSVPAAAGNFMASLAGKEKDVESPKEKEQPSTPISFGGFGMPAVATNFMASLGGKEKDVETREQPSTPISFGGFNMPKSASGFLSSFQSTNDKGGGEPPSEDQQPSTPSTFGFNIPAAASGFLASLQSPSTKEKSIEESESQTTPVPAPPSATFESQQPSTPSTTSFGGFNIPAAASGFLSNFQMPKEKTGENESNKSSFGGFQLPTSAGGLFASAFQGVLPGSESVKENERAVVEPVDDEKVVIDTVMKTEQKNDQIESREIPNAAEGEDEMSEPINEEQPTSTLQDDEGNHHIPSEVDLTLEVTLPVESVEPVVETQELDAVDDFGVNDSDAPVERNINQLEDTVAADHGIVADEGPEVDDMDLETNEEMKPVENSDNLDNEEAQESMDDLEHEDEMSEYEQVPAQDAHDVDSQDSPVEVLETSDNVEHKLPTSPDQDDSEIYKSADTHERYLDSQETGSDVSAGGAIDDIEHELPISQIQDKSEVLNTPVHDDISIQHQHERIVDSEMDHGDVLAGEDVNEFKHELPAQPLDHGSEIPQADGIALDESLPVVDQHVNPETERNLDDGLDGEIESDGLVKELGIEPIEPVNDLPITSDEERLENVVESEPVVVPAVSPDSEDDVELREDDLPAAAENEGGFRFNDSDEGTDEIQHESPTSPVDHHLEITQPDQI
ncbi:hypothetical protein HDU76_000169, partial [Blyttiomyces sp. JEL0837]